MNRMTVFTAAHAHWYDGSFAFEDVTDEADDTETINETINAACITGQEVAEVCYVI